MIFASDNWSGASEKILAAFAKAASCGGPAYGEDALTNAAQARFNEVFEREVAVFFVASGTAANALALSAYARPGGIIFAHEQAHIAADEAGAVEFFSAGNRVAALPAIAGKISPDGLAYALGRSPERDVHHGRAVAVSVTQITEYGAAYSADEVSALSDVAKSRGLAVHMDGARFANAVVGLGVAPADLTWRAGVDVLSFGGTKTGCFAAEAVVFFDPAAAHDFAYARQRAGQGFSKNWFIAAQFDAYLQDDHWLDLARHANRMAGRLAESIALSGSARLALEPDGNEVFAIVGKRDDARLRGFGAVYHPWPADGFAGLVDIGADECVIRLVTSFQTTAEDVDRFAALL